jgi:carboxyl-terminal processing protease
LKGVVPDIRIPSVLDVLDVGEEFLPHAIPWTVISMARYHPVQDLAKRLPGLKVASEARRAKDPRFMAQRDVIERIKAHQMTAGISLNLKDRITLAREEKVLDKVQDEALGEGESESEATPLGPLEKDLVLKESSRILADMLRDGKGKELKNENSVLENAWSWK